MPVRILPQELFDNIIDHAHDDPSTLKDCALVCWSWLPSSRYHRFHRVSLRVTKGVCSDDNADAFEDTTDDTISDSECLYRIIKLSPEIIPYIHNLVIRDGSQCGGTMGKHQADTLPLLLRSLTSLRTLEFEPSYPLYRWPSNLIDSICAAQCLPSVTELRLLGLPYYNQAHFVAMLYLCPALTVLQMKDVHFVPWEIENVNTTGDNTATTKRTPAILDSLSVESPSSPAVIDFLLHRQSSIDLSNLFWLRVTISGDSASMTKLLHATPRLEHLEIELTHNISSRSSVPDPLDISANPLLRSLSLSFRLHLRHDPLPWLYDLFASVAPTSELEEVALVVTIDRCSPDLEQQTTYKESLGRWRRLDGVLAGLGLQRVRVGFVVRGGDRVGAGVVEDVVRQLEGLDACREGMLRVDVCEVR